MMVFSVLSGALLSLAIFPIANGAPAAISSASAPSASASNNAPLRGSEDLLGFSSENVFSPENTGDIPYQPVEGQNDNAIDGFYLDFESTDNPQPIRGSKGATDPGPRNTDYDRINSDKFAPPGTDNSATINAQWPMGLSHNRLGLNGAGWARQENTKVMPAATAMAGVDMRLEAGAYRELHWHVASEWSLILNGSVRISSINEDGQTYIDDLAKGDVWFFPPGVPHSVQALENGTEFLLVFDDGSFSEDNTFLTSDVFSHQPREVLSKNFGVPMSAFDNIPTSELYIFPGTPAPKDIQEQNVTGSAGSIPKNQSYSYHFSEQPAHEVAGGSVKIVDPLTFPIATKFSAALVTVKPGGLREIHWHPSSDEWSFFIAGKARGTLFSAPGSATTFDYRPGDVGYFPQSNSHYIENTGDTDLIFLEVLQADHFSDISLGQWVGSTSKQIIKDSLNLSDETLDQFSTEKQYVVAGSTNLTSS